MRFLENIPIKRKLRLISMLASGIALLGACLAFFTYEQVTARKRLVRDSTIIAEMTGANTASGLLFDDAVSTEQTLQSLAAHPSIVHACVYGTDGRPFALYERGKAKTEFSPPAVQPDAHQFGNDRLELFHRFNLNLTGEKSGTIYLAMDLQEMTNRIWRYALIVAGVLIASVLIAFLLAARLERVISDPLEALARIVTLVGREKDYSVRAVKSGEDELGRLIEGFNEMLSQIQRRDGELEAARKNLENRVEQRTQELAGSLSLLNATLESTADGILAVDLAGKVSCYNSNFARMWKIPLELLAKGDSVEIAAATAMQTTDPEQFLARIAEIRAAPLQEVSHVIALSDGRTFEGFVRPQYVENRCVGRVIIHRDITERKRTQAKLEQVSRQAGMAEVATGVLHNVGNVLNSVNVSSTLIREQLRNSRAAKLEKLATLLREHADELPAFFANDPRGKHVTPFVVELAKQFGVERANLEREAELVAKNVEHIKEIVAMQQNYARASGVVDTVRITDLVNDALEMDAASFSRRGIRLFKQYDASPKITVDRNKVLQILLNILGNARYALESSDRSDLLIRVRIQLSDTKTVQVSIADNGTGIAPENLTRIFGHGFTTRKDGHGFGLHSGAIAATEMGGRLSAQSEGVGRGATFVLELPVVEKETKQ